MRPSERSTTPKPSRRPARSRRTMPGRGLPAVTTAWLDGATADGATVDEAAGAAAAGAAGDGAAGAEGGAAGSAATGGAAGSAAATTLTHPIPTARKKG